MIPRRVKLGDIVEEEYLSFLTYRRRLRINCTMHLFLWISDERKRVGESRINFTCSNIRLGMEGEMEEGREGGWMGCV